jgi:short-subunit dehydrogenase
MTGYYQDKVVIVTGGTDGIGRALVKQLIQAGAKVATCGRNQDKLYSLQTEFPGQSLHTLVADVSRYDDCENLVNTTAAAFGGIDIIINNAGVSMRALVEDLELSVIEKVMNINFYGAVYASKLALPYILQRQGSIVGVSSIAGYRGLPGRSGYSASKFALQGWLESLRTELLDSGVNVMWVCPGFTSSNIRNAALNKDGKHYGETTMDEDKMMSSEDCARHILRSIEKRKRTLVLTFTGKRTIFMNKFFPSLTDRMVRKFFFKEGKLVR